MNKRTEQTRWTPKRLLSLLMALIMTLSLLPTAAFADDEGGDTVYEYSKLLNANVSTEIYKWFNNNEECVHIDIYPNELSEANNGKTAFEEGETVNIPLHVSMYFQPTDSTRTESYSVRVGYDGKDYRSNYLSASYSVNKQAFTFNSTKKEEKLVITTTASSANDQKLGVTCSLLRLGSESTNTQIGSISFEIKLPLVQHYTVTYDANGGTLSAAAVNGTTRTEATEENPYSQVFDIPAEAKSTLSGYTFEGWQVSGDGSFPTGVVSSGTMIDGITGDITLKANLVKNQEISFDPVYSGVSGLPYDYKDMSQGQTYTIPYTPELSGYDFKGWTVTGATLDADGVSVKDITSQITITPIWEKSDGSTPVGSHKVTFVRNNTTDGSALNWPDDLTGAKDSTVTIPWNIPRAEGYTFLGWSTTENATTADTTYAPGAPVTLGDADITLYAVWQAKNYTITYTPNTSLTGVTLSSTTSSVTPGDPVSFNVTVTAQYDASSMIVAANGVPLGYSAKTEDANGSTTYTYSFVPTGDTAVTVSQPEQKSYVVTLPVGDHFTAKFDGTDTKSDKTVTYNGSVSFTVTADSGWTIEDVSYTGDATLTRDTTDLTKYTLTDIKSNVAVSVKMKQIPVYTISYSIDEAYFTSQKVTGESANVTLITPAERTGYTFEGWYQSPNYTGTKVASLDVTGDVNLYGYYMPITKSISYDMNAPQDANDSSLAVDPTSLPPTEKTYGQAVTLSAVKPTCDGYDFLGWAKARDSKTVVYAAGATVSEELTADMTLYAVWAKKTYTITLQGGSGYTVSSNQALVVEHGSTFTFTVTVDGAYAATRPTVSISNTTNGNLTGPNAGEGPNSTHTAATYTYTISNVTADQVVTVKVTENARATVTFQYRVVDSQGNEVTVTGLSGETFMTQAVQLGDPAAQPQQPNIEGYKFVRWCGADHTTATHEAYDFTKPVTDELTIYAEITPILPVITVTNALSGLGWKTENWQYGTETMTNADTTNKFFTIAYGDNVTFDLVISEGYDYSKLSVTANGLALGYQSATTNTDGSTTLHYYLGSVMADTRIAITGIERKTITITYNANARDDVSGLPTAEKVKYYLEALGETGNDKITTQVPSRTGYTFLGWNTDSEAKKADSRYTAEKIRAGAASEFTQDTTLYAIWKAQDTTLTLKITDVAYDTQQNDRVIQYEGESITLQATLNVNAKGTVVFYKGDKEGTNGTRIGSAAINGKTAELSVKVGDYKAGGVTEHYWAVFESETDEGYANSEKSNIMNVGVFSKALSWKITGGTSNVADNGNVLNVYEGDSATGTPITGNMVAGHTYTLEVKTASITGVETLDNKQPVLGKDYKIVWQYYEVDTNDWKTVSESSDKATYLVTSELSGYQFRAQIVPLGKDHDSLYLKAAKYGDAGLLKDQYDVCLYTKPTAATTRQTTTTTLTVTGADNEENDVYINGTQPFNATAGSHLAQFEGQKVTLTATVKDTTTNVGVKSGEVKFFRYVDGTKDELLNTTLIGVDSNGVATCEVEISKWTDGKSVTDNKDKFYAVYQPNATYNTSDSKADLKAVYIKSTAIKTPIIESKLEGEGSKNATTYTDKLTGLLAGVEHTFTLRQTGADGVSGQTDDWSVVALDGRTVEAKNYTIQWITKTGDNEIVSSVTGSEFKTSDNKVGDEIYVRLNPTGDMKTGADSKKAIIGKKQGVKVTVEAIDAIDKTPTAKDVYQLNEIELRATVTAADAKASMQPDGLVQFYYVDDNNFVEIGKPVSIQTVGGARYASIKTNQLPVTAVDNTKRDVKITAVYLGDTTFKASDNWQLKSGSTTEWEVTAADITDTVKSDTVTVYSSVVYAGDSENKAATQSSNGIVITANGALKANESSVTLTLGQVYTLDHPIDLSKLTYNTDYTVQWQILKNALQHQDSSAGSYATTDKWEDLPNQTGSSYTGTMEQDAAYRAKITVMDTPIAKGSFTKVDQAIKGRDVYYSNVLVVGAGMATVTTNITTSANQKFNEEGIVSGETATIHVLASGAAKTTPISTVTATITKIGATEPVFNEKANNVNGYTSFAWDTADLTPGYYTLTVKAESNNGYAPQTITRTLIVRDNAYTLKATKESKVYNGKAQGIDWTLTGVDIENALAQKSVVVYYYDKDGKMVEPTQAGEYRYDLYLPASAYWTELTHITGTFTIEKRSVKVDDLVAQAKVYDGTNNANIQEIILNDSAVNSDGIATGDEGIIDGDSVYAVGTGYTDKAAAGTAKLGVKDVTLMGDDAANYEFKESDYTEVFNIQRSQVKGAIVSGRTYKYTGKDIKLAASDIYLIDQAGNQLTDYDVTYYYHNGDGVEKVDAMNKMGKYTVIARPEQDNYKGGATETVYVGTADNAGTLDKSAVSSLITISNTVELFGATENEGIVATATNNATVTVEYQNGTGWSATRPTAAGRYLVKVTTSTGDTAYGLYTVVKARPALTLTATGATYNSAQYNGTPNGTYNGGTLPADTYFTYTGGTIQGVAYEAPTEAGDYVVTAHVGKTPNYTAHEISTNFTIAKAALTIKADDLQRWQYGSFPDMVASYQGLATSGIAADTSLRDVQIQPEFLFNEKNGGYTNHAFDQVGTYPVTVRNALARNYTVTYKDGTIAITREEPKAELAIHGMPDNGTPTENLVYYGDTIQLYAYGYYKTLDSSRGSYNTSSLIEWSVSDASIAEIDQSGLLTIKGVGAFKVTLKRGSGSAAISTDIDVTAEKQEVKVVVPDQDLIYNGAEQKYDGSKFYAENAKGERITATPYMHDGKVKRTNVGSQIITSWVGDTNATYQSEHYCGLFTINVKDVTVTPNEISVIYGEALGTLGTPGTLGYSENDTVGGVAALTDGKAVSERDAYINLDVLDGYEILVAGRENENYNVKYVTDQAAPDVKVTAKDLSISTGTLNSDGRTSGYLKDNDQFYMNEGFAITGTTFNLTPNDRMYGEVNPVMDYTFAGFVSGDSEADLVTLLPWLVKYSDGTYHNINGNANVAFDKTNHLNGFRATSFMSGMSAYLIDSMLLANSVKNYTLASTEATQNIYQRPVTLKLREGLTKLTAYKPEILGSSGSVTTEGKAKLLELLLNNLVVDKYNGEGGLAELLKHTIEDLNIQIDTISVSADKLTLKLKLGNQNYWLDSASSTIEIELVSTKIVPVYSPLDWTSFTVTMYNETKTTPVAISGNVRFFIFQKKDGVELKYSNYKNDTIIRSDLMESTGRTGEFRATFSRLPAGDYAIFAIAENYTIVE